MKRTSREDSTLSVEKPDPACLDLIDRPDKPHLGFGQPGLDFWRFEQFAYRSTDVGFDPRTEQLVLG